MDGHRIDQPREYRPAGIAEIISLGEHQPRHPLLRIALGRVRELLRAEAGRVDDGIDRDRLRIGAAEIHVPAIRRLHHPLDRRVERDHAAVVFEIAAQRQHVAMAVDDAGLRREHGEEAESFRLEAPRRRGVDQLDAFAAVDLRLLVDFFDPGGFPLVGGDDELAAFAVRHAVRGAELVEHPSRARAVIGALGAGRVIEPGVDDLAVARRGAGADAVGRFRHDHLMAGHRRPRAIARPTTPAPTTRTCMLTLSPTIPFFVTRKPGVVCRRPVLKETLRSFRKTLGHARIFLTQSDQVGPG